MTKVKGKNVRLQLGTGSTVNKTIAGCKSLSVRLTTKFDEERDKDNPDGPFRQFMWVEMSGTISGRVKEAGTNQLTIVDLETIGISVENQAYSIITGVNTIRKRHNLIS